MKNNTMKKTDFNIDQKSYLAKLLATENIEVQVNNVETASFDVANRILTLPRFKIKSQDVQDMLIGHECSHALHTDMDAWLKIGDDEKLRMACNVLEDARIDKLIQKKYPGLSKNYINGFDLMMKHNFFGLKDVDLQKLSLIDKINMYFKSSKRMKLQFTKDELSYVEKTDNLKNMDDVIALAKDIINYQDKKDQEQELNENDIKVSNKSNDDNQDEKDNSSNTNQDNNQDNDNQDEEDNQNSKDGKEDDEEDNSLPKDLQDEEKSNQSSYGQEGVEGDDTNKPFSITQKAYDENVSKVINSDGRDRYDYVKLSKPNLEHIVINWKEHAQNMRKFHNYYTIKSTDDSYSARDKQRYHEIKSEYQSFKKDSMKTVNYLVKEFEMKKSATAYKRATTDKTGVLDPLKLKNYKFSDDIFKRLTILPDAKNHGMYILLDWSGSMADIISDVVEQMANLVWFCKKVNIPFEVYSFGQNQSHREDDDNLEKYWSMNTGDLYFSKFGLINLLSSEMKSKDIDRALFELFCITDRHRNYDGLYTTHVPSYMDLYSTPLNEALVSSIDLLKEFKKKYKLEKTIFVTMTDGAANSGSGVVYPDKEASTEEWGRDKGSHAVIKRGNKRYLTNYHSWSSRYEKTVDMTSTLMQIIKDEVDTVNIGYYLHKKCKRFDYNMPELTEKDFRDYRKNKFHIEKNKNSYDGYYHLVMNNKVQSLNLENLDGEATKGQILTTFKKGMKGRLTSRVFMNNLIEKIA